MKHRMSTISGVSDIRAVKEWKPRKATKPRRGFAVVNAREPKSSVVNANVNDMNDINRTPVVARRKKRLGFAMSSRLGKPAMSSEMSAMSGRSGKKRKLRDMKG